MCQYLYGCNSGKPYVEQCIKNNNCLFQTICIGISPNYVMGPKSTRIHADQNLEMVPAAGIGKCADNHFILI